MTNLFKISSLICLIGTLSFFFSCQEIVTDIDCGDVETDITELRQFVGSFGDSTFYTSNSTNYEETAIRIIVEAISIDSEKSCFTFTSIPQKIDKVDLTSTTGVTSGGVEYAPGVSLNSLFKLNNKGIFYTFSEFVEAHIADPQIFNSEEDDIILQLIEKPDVSINQSFDFQVSFDDNQVINLKIPNFEVVN